MSFESDLLAFANKSSKELDRIQRKSAFDLFALVVVETPVLAGVLRSNWYPTIGYRNLQQTSLKTVSNTDMQQRIRSALQGASVGNNLFLTNNLPYAERIEFDGYSEKAPDGMVRVNALNWSTIVLNNVRNDDDDV